MRQTFILKGPEWVPGQRHGCVGSPSRPRAPAVCGRINTSAETRKRGKMISGCVFRASPQPEHVPSQPRQANDPVFFPCVVSIGITLPAEPGIRPGSRVWAPWTVGTCCWHLEHSPAPPAANQPPTGTPVRRGLCSGPLCLRPQGSHAELPSGALGSDMHTFLKMP